MTEEISNQDLLRFFKSDRKKVPDSHDPSRQKTASRSDTYAKPLRALEEFLASHDPGVPLPTSQFLEAWLVFLFFRGLTAKTAIHYLDILSALYSRAVESLELPPVTAFSDVKKRLKQALPDVWRSELRESSLSGLLKLLKSSLDGEADPMAPAVRDLVLATLLTLGMKIEEMAMIRKEDIERFDEPVREILQQHVDPRRKFFFPFDQTKYTPRQFRNHIEALTRRLFEQHLLQWFGNADTTLKTYWAVAALRCGLSPHRVTAVTGPLPSTLPILGLALGESSLAEIKSGVAEGHDNLHPCTPAPWRRPGAALAALLLSNPLRWYAMRMRRGVRFDHLEKRMEIATERLPKPTLYYPYEEITRRIGKRMEFKRKPVISDIVFFRYRATEIPRLFREIGDLAWCYRIGGEYAAIPQQSMQAFQQTVGMFTPDYEVGEGGTLTLRENEKVVVLGGMFAGLEGKVLEAQETARGIVYRLRLFGESNDIEWRLADPALLRPLP